MLQALSPEIAGNAQEIMSLTEYMHNALYDVWYVEEPKKRRGFEDIH